MKFIWNKDRSGSFRLDLVRNFTIQRIGIESSISKSSGYSIVAWFSDNESVCIGEFLNVDSCRDFLDDIHKNLLS